MGVTCVVCVGLPSLTKCQKKRVIKNRADKNRADITCMQVMTEMKLKVGKDPGGGSKNRKEVGNESPWTSMFQKQQIANESNRMCVYYNG